MIYKITGFWGDYVTNLADMERSNIFDYLRPYKNDIARIFGREGTRATRAFLYKKHKIRLKGWELRKFLGVEPNYIVRDAKALSQSVGYKTTRLTLDRC